MSTILRVLGQPVRPLERIARAGQILGIASKSTAYRLARIDEWPMTGSPGNQWVLMMPLLERYCIPYREEEPGDWQALYPSRTRIEVDDDGAIAESDR